MKDGASCVATEEFIGLKEKMYSFLVDDNSENKKAKDMDKNIVATISYDEYKEVLLSNKCIRRSMNRSYNRIIGNQQDFVVLL